MIRSYGLTPPAFANIPVRMAADVAARYEMSHEAAALLAPALRPRQYFELLVEKQRYEDAVAFLAHALKPRDAVWWGCLCIGEELSMDADSRDHVSALEAAVRWVLDPSENHRVAAQRMVDERGVSTPADYMALAVYWSGNLAPTGSRTLISPPPYLYGTAVSTAICLAAVSGSQEKISARYQWCLRAGTHVALTPRAWEYWRSSRPEPA